MKLHQIGYLVTLESGTFNVTAHNSGKVYTINRQTALGALDASGASYTVTDECYAGYDHLFIDSINGINHPIGASQGWVCAINKDTNRVGTYGGVDACPVYDEDEVCFFVGGSLDNAPPENSSNAIYIKVNLPSTGGSSSGNGGGATPAPTSAPTQIIEGTKDRPHRSRFERLNDV